MGILAGVGGLLALIGWIWLVIVGFQVGGVLWGILNILLQPITGLIFCIVKKAGWIPFILMIVGVVLAVGSGGAAGIGNYPGIE